MSASSRTLKKHELPKLREAQILAAQETDYFVWREKMRSICSYSCAVRMCVYVGCKIPSRGFFLKMKKEGIKLQKKALKGQAA